ncbi:uncharacterized protein LTR77_009434 [Saxophila tyrrhenica]|uniref:Uncharacterized protein n=1 Tax=Saxophila tyrrhenica TaxID=1690608 RepID=A0AAV9NZF9_9PEZI|nr:hypothetical protein LTR77_009434 [Saxophila tyrrhenica]
MTQEYELCLTPSQSTETGASECFDGLRQRLNSQTRRIVSSVGDAFAEFNTGASPEEDDGDDHPSHNSNNGSPGSIADRGRKRKRVDDFREGILSSSSSFDVLTPSRSTASIPQAVDDDDDDDDDQQPRPASNTGRSGLQGVAEFLRERETPKRGPGGYLPGWS